MTDDGAEPLRTDLTPVADAVADASADAFVAVGDRCDDDARYLTRFVGPDRRFGLVVAPGSASSPPRAVLLAPAGFGPRAERAFVDGARTTGPDDGTARVDDGIETDDESTAADVHDGIARCVRTDRVGDPVGVRAARVVDGWRDDGEGVDGTAGDGGGDDRTDAGGHLLVPRSIPHDAAVYLQRAGYDLASTPVVAEARAIKTSTEVDRIRRVQRAAAAGMARAETVLARSDTDEGSVLRWDGDELTTGRLGRAVNAMFAGHGARDAGNTAVIAGPGTASHRGFGDDAVRVGEPVLVDLAPRGPDGYYGTLARTFVVDGDGGWARRADVAVEAARTAGLAAVEPGDPVSDVRREVTAELAAYGFDPRAADGQAAADAGMTPRTGHGVGLSRRELPSPTADSALRPGHVIAIGPGVTDPEHGTVRLADLIVVTEGGYEGLVEYPLGTVPSERE